MRHVGCYNRPRHEGWLQAGNGPLDTREGLFDSRTLVVRHFLGGVAEVASAASRLSKLHMHKSMYAIGIYQINRHFCFMEPKICTFGIRAGETFSAIFRLSGKPLFFFRKHTSRRGCNDLCNSFSNGVSEKTMKTGEICGLHYFYMKYNSAREAVGCSAGYRDKEVMLAHMNLVVEYGYGCLDIENVHIAPDDYLDLEAEMGHFTSAHFMDTMHMKPEVNSTPSAFPSRQSSRRTKPGSSPGSQPSLF